MFRNTSERIGRQPAISPQQVHKLESTGVIGWFVRSYPYAASFTELTVRQRKAHCQLYVRALDIEINFYPGKVLEILTRRHDGILNVFNVEAYSHMLDSVLPAIIAEILPQPIAEEIVPELLGRQQRLREKARGEIVRGSMWFDEEDYHDLDPIYMDIDPVFWGLNANYWSNDDYSTTEDIYITRGEPDTECYAVRTIGREFYCGVMPPWREYSDPFGYYCSDSDNDLYEPAREDVPAKYDDYPVVFKSANLQICYQC